MPVPHHSVFYRPDAFPAAQPTVSKHLLTYMYAEIHIFPHVYSYFVKLLSVDRTQLNDSDKTKMNNINIFCKENKERVYALV